MRKELLTTAGALGVLIASGSLTPASAVGGYRVDTNRPVAYIQASPSISAPTLASLPNGTVFSDLVCQTPGDQAGVFPFPTNATWNKVVFNGVTGYITDMRVNTAGNGQRENLGSGGYFLPTVGIPRCGAAAPPTTVPASPKTQITPGYIATVRAGANSTALAVGSIPGGTPVTMECWLDGGYATGAYLSQRWFKLVGTQFVHSSLVINQTTVPVCPTGPLVASDAERAALWASSKVGQTVVANADENNGNGFTFWSGWCEVLAEDSYRIGAGRNLGNFSSAAAHAAAKPLQGGAPPRGSLAFYSGAGGLGHVVVGIGGGQVVGTSGVLGQQLPVIQHAYNDATRTTDVGLTFLGWYVP
jgi:hypothetical protein